MQQLSLESGRSKTIETVPIEHLILSRFNTRRTRPQADIERLADRIERLGFEVTRAPWACRGEGDSLEVFAGGTRLEAARTAGKTEIPVVVHEGYSDDEIARLADEDNEADEYHARVPVLDVWAEYHRLWKDEGWTQARIGAAKGCDVPTVSRRVKWHSSLPSVARQATCDGIFDEGHCEALSSLTCDVASLARWLTTEQAQAELVAEVLGKHRGKTEGIKPTVATVRDAAKRWKAMIEAAGDALDRFSDDGWRHAFVAALVESNARSLAAVNAAYARTSKAKAAADEGEARRKRAEADEAGRLAEEERARTAAAEMIAALTARVVLGDAREAFTSAPDGIHLLLTDPPYGQDFQSQRRKTSPKKATIANDGEVEARALLRNVLALAYPKMDDDSTLLCFTGWRNEPAFRNVIEAAGFTVKGSLVWVKANHGTGDLSGSFAPRHERIIHAVKGKPGLRKRPDDVLYGKDKQNSEHPTEKPRDLLRQLIEATTDEGQLVADPFAGSGSTLLEALALDRAIWGCEIDEMWHRKITDALMETFK
uniref:Putative methyltransferase n=1 Tax=viral metagenome TaxID=1070528 RepID=A0A6M3KRE1_9ZZZZ